MRPAGVALAAGSGTRLRPLTLIRPKALCPINGRALLDLALDRLEPLAGSGSGALAVNAQHLAEQVRRHVEDGPRRAHLQVERSEALGTAGALAALRPWLDGRAALVTNADSYLPAGLGALAGGSTEGFTAGWDGERCRLLCRPSRRRADFLDADGTGLEYVGACLLPWAKIADLQAVPSGLYEVLWRREALAGALDLVRLPAWAVAIDCGTPADYLAANLHASGGHSVVGAGAKVFGRLEHSVVWAGAWVGPEESLSRAVRAGDREHPITVSAG